MTKLSSNVQENTFLQESHTSRIEQRKKEKADKLSMRGEMDEAIARKKAEEDAVNAKEGAVRSRERDAIAAPGTGRRPTTGGAGGTPSLSSKRRMLGL